MTFECPAVEVNDQGVCIRLPGGAEICAQLSETNPDKLQIGKDLIGQANAALSPLVPIFNIIDALLAVKACIDAIPDALGPPPDPSKLSSCIPALGEKIAAVAALIPQLSVPILLVDCIDALLLVLNGLIERYTRIALQEARVAEAGLKAQEPGNESLGEVVGCAVEINLSIKESLGQGMESVNRFVGLINLFMGLIGLDPIPVFDELPENTAAAIEQITKVTKALEIVRDAIPVP